MLTTITMQGLTLAAIIAAKKQIDVNSHMSHPAKLYEPRHEKMCLRESPTRQLTN